MAGSIKMRADFKRQSLVASLPVLPDPHRSAMPAPGLQNMPVESLTGDMSAPAESAVWQGGKGMADPQPEGESSPVAPVGRRSAPRLRISLPAQLIAVDKVHSCILMNLSRTGAQVAILDSLRKGEGAILRCGAIDHFAIVTRSEFGLNALTFDEPLSDALVIEIRRYNENFEERERRALIETARKWVTGDSGDDRPI
jgi:hypothetical protein